MNLKITRERNNTRAKHVELSVRDLSLDWMGCGPGEMAKIFKFLRQLSPLFNPESGEDYFL